MKNRRRYRSENDESFRRAYEAAESRVVDAINNMARAQGVAIQRMEQRCVTLGSTAASTWIVTVVHDYCKSQMYFVKLGPAEEILAAVSGHARMRDAFGKEHIQEIKYHEPGVIVLPFLIGYCTVDDLLIRSEPDPDHAASVWSRFVDHVLAMWLRTWVRDGASSAFFNQRISSRTQQSYDRFKALKCADGTIALRDLAKLTLVVNGNCYPPVEQMIAEALRLMAMFPPKVLVLSSLDEHFANVLCVPGAPACTFTLIDLGNAGYGDFSYVIAKMVHYPRYIPILVMKQRIDNGETRQVAVIRIEGGVAYIDYELTPVPAGCDVLVATSIRAGDTFANWIADPGHPSRLAACLFSTLWSGIPHHAGYQQVIPILIGEAARLFKEYHPDPDTVFK